MAAEGTVDTVMRRADAKPRPGPKRMGAAKVHAIDVRAPTCAGDKSAEVGGSSPRQPQHFNRSQTERINNKLYWAYELRPDALVDELVIRDQDYTVAFGFAAPPFTLVEKTSSATKAAHYGRTSAFERYTLPFLLGRRPRLPIPLQQALVQYVHANADSPAPIVPFEVVVDRSTVRGLEVVDVGWTMRPSANRQLPMRDMVVAVNAKPPGGAQAALDYSKTVTWHPHTAFLGTSLDATSETDVDNISYSLWLFLHSCRAIDNPVPRATVGVTPDAVALFRKTFKGHEDSRLHPLSASKRQAMLHTAGAIVKQDPDSTTPSYMDLCHLGRAQLVTTVPDSEGGDLDVVVHKPVGARRGRLAVQAALASTVKAQRRGFKPVRTDIEQIRPPATPAPAKRIILDDDVSMPEWQPEPPPPEAAQSCLRFPLWDSPTLPSWGTPHLDPLLADWDLYDINGLDAGFTVPMQHSPPRTGDISEWYGPALMVARAAANVTAARQQHGVAGVTVEMLTNMHGAALAMAEHYPGMMAAHTGPYQESLPAL